jgi:NADH-quinone oxidoreductase subunit E
MSSDEGATPAPSQRSRRGAATTAPERLSDSTRAAIQAARDRYPQPRSAILPALWAVQGEVGHLTPWAMREVADLLSLPPSEVEATATFYSMYFQHPHGRHEVLVCVNVSCALRGADAIVDYMAQRLGCASGETSADGEFTWASTIECLGACGGAPAMQVDHHHHENLTTERVDSILDVYRRSSGADGEAAGTRGKRGAMGKPPGPRIKPQRSSGGEPER